MNDAILFLILGLGLGSIYAMLGAGLVVVYRGSGVINFAQGAMAMYGVFTFDEARRNGVDQAAVGRLPADDVAQRPGHDHALRRRGVGHLDGRSAWPWRWPR